MASLTPDQPPERPAGRLNGRLDEAPVQTRILVTLFLMVTALGLAAAHVHLYLHHRHADGQAAFTLDDVVADLHGKEGARPLVNALDGNMAQYVESAEEADLIIEWVVAGAPERAYHLEVADVIADRCTTCHSPKGEARQVLLTNYEEVMKQVRPRWHQPSWNHIARVTHLHLLTLGALWTLMGLITVLSGPPSWLRCALAALPLMGLILDTAGIWLAPLSRPCVWLVIIGGALMGVGFLGQLLVVSYRMWIRRPSPSG